MRLLFWRRRRPQPPLNADFELHSIVTPIPFPMLDSSDSIIPLLEARMDEAERSMSAYLSRQLWPQLPWYRRLWGRARGAFLVLIGRREAVTRAVAFHVCRDDEEEE